MKVTALQIRQHFGKILKRLLAADEPIIIEKGRAPVAVLISLKTFKERFVDVRERQQRQQLVEAFRETAVTPTADSLTILRELRYGSNH